MKYINNRIVAIALASIITFMQAIPVEAISVQEQEESELSSINVADVIKSVDKVEMECEAFTKKGDQYISETDKQIVTFDSNNSIKITTDNAEKLEIGMGVCGNEQMTATRVDDIIVMDNNNNDYFVTTEVFDGGLRNCFVIEKNVMKKNFR